jgi:hypothetical protein
VPLAAAPPERLRLPISTRVQHPQTVRRLALLGILCAAVLVQSAGATTVAPRSLVLRQSDVPASYRLNPDKSGRRTVAQDSVGYPGLRTKFVSWGRLGGYQNQFDKGDDSIASRADVFHDRSGARQMLAWFVGEMQRQGVLQLRGSKVPLGDEGVEYSFTGGDLRFTIVLWRYRRVFSIVGAGGLERARALGLARTQQRRVAAALR